ncbi:MAG: hypothetical protein IJ901_08195 [Bacteroidaceae bacterium]|nr:hypothetical protein [Bacteroidaceae bacterium]
MQIKQKVCNFAATYARMRKNMHTNKRRKMDTTGYINSAFNEMAPELLAANLKDAPNTQVSLNGIWAILQGLTAHDKQLVVAQLLKEIEREDMNGMRATPYVLSIGKKVDLSDILDEKEAYRRHLKEKYA